METVSFIVSALTAFIIGLFPVHASAPVAPASRHTPDVPRATIVFGGDMMFDRNVRAIAVRQGEDYLFSCVDNVLSAADLVVANLEGPVTGNSSVSMGSDVGGPDNYTFTFPTTTPAFLARHNLRLVNIGNNHIMNFGHDGLLETKKWLESAKVGYFGDPDAVEAQRVARVEVRGIPFSFVNWSDWTSDKTDHTVAQVRQEAAAGRIVVVYAHWGEEYVPPPERVHALARQFADAGASIVIGSHPHIVQEHELFGATPIYYSLGNFVFDQYWNESVRTGLLLSVSFTSDGVTAVREIPIHIGQGGRPCPVE